MRTHRAIGPIAVVSIVSEPRCAAVLARPSLLPTHLETGTGIIHTRMIQLLPMYPLQRRSTYQEAFGANSQLDCTGLLPCQPVIIMVHCHLFTYLHEWLKKFR